MFCRWQFNKCTDIEWKCVRLLENSSTVELPSTKSGSSSQSWGRRAKKSFHQLAPILSTVQSCNIWPSITKWCDCYHPCAFVHRPYLWQLTIIYAYSIHIFVYEVAWCEGKTPVRGTSFHGAVAKTRLLMQFRIKT